ncbi:ligase-associated DNA damage response exonuclease [Maribacter litoralis]|uniref:ligase-associated DNA damage response exonuclease n=1 Tax=Maribacter litoralis TaxID=2059726 RepID=UPI003F5CC37F
MKTPLLQFTDNGIYCKKANVYLDPWKPVDHAIISHGHADHSRYGHKKYITHHRNVPIIQHRLGEINVTGKEWGETFDVNNVKFSLHPAGHILGSSQIRVEYKGEGKTSILFGYSLGKAQRLLKYLNTDIGEIYTHGAIENMTEVLRPLVDFPKTTLITRETKKEQLLGNIVLAPPSAHGSTWIRKMVPYVTASASGWMTFRGARRRRAIDKGFVLSDHCDWGGLLESIEATGADKIICTHGYTDIFSKYLREQGYDARTEATQYGEEETEAALASKSTASV